MWESELGDREHLKDVRTESAFNIVEINLFEVFGHAKQLISIERI